MKKTLGLFLVLVLTGQSFQTAESQTTVQAGIFNEPAGSNILVVRAKPSGDLSGVFSTVNVTIQWSTSYGVTLSLVSTDYSIAPQGASGTDGANSYQTYGSSPGATIAWASGSENELFRVRVDGALGTGTFALTNGPVAETAWHFGFDGFDIADVTTTFYQPSVSEVSLPIQLSFFVAEASTDLRTVVLNWHTLSEIDNLGFDVQRSLRADGPFETIAASFQAGHGTTVEPQDYCYIDVNTEGKSWYYRLRQTDRSGSVHYSGGVQAIATGVEREQALPKAFGLQQNYPNPFNPVTIIRYTVGVAGGEGRGARKTTIVVYDLLGREVGTLLDEMKPPGYYEVTFDGSGFASGVYIYRMTAGNFVQTRKMTLVK